MRKSIVVLTCTLSAVAAAALAVGGGTYAYWQSYRMPDEFASSFTALVQAGLRADDSGTAVTYTLDGCHPLAGEEYLATLHQGCKSGGPHFARMSAAAYPDDPGGADPAAAYERLRAALPLTAGGATLGVGRDAPRNVDDYGPSFEATLTTPGGEQAPVVCGYLVLPASSVLTPDDFTAVENTAVTCTLTVAR